MSSLRIKLGYALLCLIWGTTWMAIRVLVRDVPPVRAAGLRLLVGSIALIGLALIQRAPWPRKAREWVFVTVLSFTMMGIPFGLVFWAEQFVTSSMTAVFYAATPLLVALFTPFVLKNPVPRSAIFAMLCALGASAIFAMLCALGAIAYLFNFSLRTDARSTLGGAMILLAVVSSGLSAVLAKRELRHVDPVVSTGMQLVIGGAGLYLISLFLEGGQPSEWNPRAIAALLFLALIGSAVGFTVWYALIKHVPPYKLSTTNLVVPFIAIAEGALILRESITIQMFLTAVIVAAAVAVVLRAEAEQALSLRAPVAD
jgi:drug/metabolite transporter (DMT)-like permease